MERYSFVAHVHAPQLPPELAHFVMHGPRPARFSADEQALLIPILHVAPVVIRRVATGGSLFHALGGVSLLRHVDDRTVYVRTQFSFVWGDLKVFENGKPAVERCVFIRGPVQVPDLTKVRRYLEELRMHD